MRRCRLAAGLGVLAIMMALHSCQRGFSHAGRVVIVQPFDDLKMAEITHVVTELRKINRTVLLKPAIALPASAWYAPRGRYRADSIIRFLNRYGSADTVVIGLTGKDISTTGHQQADWGIMGLAFRPGNACVVSAFRLSKTEKALQFYKVAVHELGHTQGLPHCAVKTCLMRDAEGGNHLNEETGFCTSCKAFLQSKGWKL